ncbi:MAG: dihydroxyacetone kinase subunit DhaL [Paracoccaceae bacterium]
MDFATHDLKALFKELSARMQAERDALCALDGAVGDGDHGIAMAQGMQAASAAAEAAEGSLQDMCNAAAKAFLNAVGASSGPLYATAMLRAGKALGPVVSVPRIQVLQMIPAMRDGIVQRGKAEPGQKTMLDAWHPAADAVLRGDSPTDVAAAARAGAAATRNMVATLGRAERLGERTLGHPDPGAVSAAMVIEVITAAAA